MKFVKLLLHIITVLLIVLSTSCGSGKNSAARSERKAINEMEKRQNDAIDDLVKEYDEMYKEQTDRQAKEQKKMIKKSRKKPKNMRRHERKFFLWRWLGI